MDVQAKVAALESRMKIVEAMLAHLLGEDEGDADATVEDLDGNRIPKPEDGWG
jgi:hypothetical protein